MTSLVMYNPCSKPQSVYENFRLYNPYKTLEAPLEKKTFWQNILKTLKVHVRLD